MIQISKKKVALPLLLSAALLTVSTTGCRVTKTQEGEMPDVEVKGGQVPKYDVDAPEVDVKTESREVTVPTDVDVKTEKRTVEVPTVDVKPPADNPKPPQQ
ncbi:MAG TPA: hypothetical protein VKK31_26880 [Thermoanaerobaculia bacterium]|nr:hypothetical protein [Thermoanaerobaculia bacterium]